MAEIQFFSDILICLLRHPPFLPHRFFIIHEYKRTNVIYVPVFWQNVWIFSRIYFHRVLKITPSPPQDVAAPFFVRVGDGGREGTNCISFFHFSDETIEWFYDFFFFSRIPVTAFMRVVPYGGPWGPSRG